MKRFYVILCIAVLTFTTVSCNRETVVNASNYEDKYVEGEDYNPSAINWMWAPTVFAYTEEGVYFAAGEFLFFYDPSSEAAKPLCFRANCLHNKESDPAKVPDCDAFLGGGIGQYLGVFRDNIVTFCLNEATHQRELTIMQTDGSGRKTLLADIDKIDIPNIRMHRGVIYYFATSKNLEGEQEITLNAISLLAQSQEPKAIYTVSGKNNTANMILPVSNQVYFEIESKNDEGEYTYSIYQEDIRSGEISEVTQQDHYRLYGYRAGKLILRGYGKYYEYSKDGGIQEESQGLNSFTENHSEWNCHADCIDDDLSFFSCYDNAEKGMKNNQYVVGNDGEVLCELEDEGWGYRGEQMVRIAGQTYYVRFSSNLEPFSIKAFRKEDLLAGNPEYTTLIEVNEYNAELSPSYIFSY